VCSGNTWYLSAGQTSANEFCGSVWSINTEVQSGATIGSIVCKNGSPINGRNWLWLASSNPTSYDGQDVSLAWEIDNSGMITSVQYVSCSGTTANQIF
jgi:hypothetical protein